MVAGFDELSCYDAADVAGAAGDQEFHGILVGRRVERRVKAGTAGEKFPPTENEVFSIRVTIFRCFS
ncbi:hypothetical protein Ssi02_11250 [Sinosporangium siamense]|uniref:Uncharacterized protein n=1 Tax=Sinosporangium siamense TaxID=1367973 RepID=A0A919RFM0_9ACTN|nr:hypothetical protein Ssi02_11250 [Sinosporangium siamense]